MGSLPAWVDGVRILILFINHLIVHALLCCRFAMKFYMLTQMAFWLHCYPELYFMKAKKVFIIVLKYSISAILIWYKLSWITFHPITYRSICYPRCFITPQYWCSLLEPMLEGKHILLLIELFAWFQVTAIGFGLANTTLYGRDVIPFIPDTSLSPEGVYCFTGVCMWFKWSCCKVVLLLIQVFNVAWTVSCV